MTWEKFIKSRRTFILSVPPPNEKVTEIDLTSEKHDSFRVPRNGENPLFFSPPWALLLTINSSGEEWRREEEEEEAINYYHWD